MRSNEHHSVACRKRIYKAYEDNDDVKYRTFKHLFAEKTLPSSERARGSKDAAPDDNLQKEPFEAAT